MFLLFLITFSISMYIMCVCLFSALSRSVGALQMSIIIIINVLGCRLIYSGQAETTAEARFNIALRPRKPEGSLGRTAQDGHLDSHTAPELCFAHCFMCTGLSRRCFLPQPNPIRTKLHLHVRSNYAQIITNMCFWRNNTILT